MPGGSKTAVLIMVAMLSLPFPQEPAPGAAKPSAPVIEPLAFSAVRPDATVELIGASGLAATSTGIWVARRDSGTVARLDPGTNTLAAAVAVGVGPCGAMATGLGSLWTGLCGEAGIARVDPDKNVLQSVARVTAVTADGSIAVGVGSLWAFADGSDGTLLRIDPDTGLAVAEIHLPKGSRTVAFEAEALWTAGADNGTVTRVDPHTNLIGETIKVGRQPGPIAAGEGAVWVLNRGDGSVSRIDPKSNRVTATVEIGKAAGAGWIVAAEGSVWLSAPGLPLVRIDPRTNRVAQQFSGAEGGPIAAGHASLWLLIRPGVVWRIDPRFVEALR